MNSRCVVGVGAALLAGAIVMSVVGHANAEVRYFRYELTLRSGETLHVSPLAPAADGRRHEVETDSAGRIVRVAEFHGTRKVDEVFYRFASEDAKLPSGYRVVAANGETTANVEIRRNEHGDRTRLDET